jgi:hypothetical protein
VIPIIARLGDSRELMEEVGITQMECCTSHLTSWTHFPRAVYIIPYLSLESMPWRRDQEIIFLKNIFTDLY